MRVRVYTPQKLVIDDRLIPGLEEKARKRLRLSPDAVVATRHVIEEARRAGVIELGRDYVLDLEGVRGGGSGRSRRGGRKGGRTAGAGKAMRAGAGG
jgi:hypothetical protein